MTPMQMTREERETTQLGPLRIRVGYLANDGDTRRTYFEQEAPEGWAVRARTLSNGKPIYAMTTSHSENADGEEVNGKTIHLFDKGTKPMVIIDYQNYYGEWIDPRRMTLDDYLNQEGA